MRILHILDHSLPLHSGYTFRTRAILREQRALGWETFHITSPKQGKIDSRTESVDGLTFHRSTPVATSAPPILDQCAVIRNLKAALFALVPDVKPDVLHAHSPALNGLAALSAARRFSLPLVYEVRAFWEDAAVDHGTASEWGLRYRLTRAMETHVLKRAAATTTICEGLRADIAARGIDQSRITMIPNAVDLDQFAYQPARDVDVARTLGLDDAPVIGFIGSFYAYEGLSLLLQAMPSMLAEHPRLRLLLVGGGPQEQALKSKAATLALSDAVIFSGRVPHAEVAKYYSLIDIMVYPRLPARITELVTPLKPLEAMAQGKLVVASDVGGHRELIQPGITGELFRKGDAGALAAAINTLLHNRERWDGLRDAGRSYVERERSWPASVARYRPVYERLVGRAGT